MAAEAAPDAAFAEMDTRRIASEMVAKAAAENAAIAAREAAERAAKEAAEIAAAAAKEATLRAEREKAEKAAKEAAQKEAADRIAREAAERVAREAAERAAKEKAQAEKAAREAAEKAAKEKAAAEAAEKAAAEKAAKEVAEKAAKEKAAAEKAAKEAAAKEAADRAAKERAEKAAAEKAAKEAAEKAAKEKAAKEAADRAEKAAAEKAAREAAAKERADKVAKEAAERADKVAKEAAERAEKAAAEKTAKEAAAKEAAAKEAAKERAAKEAAEKAAKEKALQEAAERAAKEAVERAAKEAAAVPPKKQPSTIDELFAELDGAGEPTKVGPAEAVRAAAQTASAAKPPSPIKDETTLDTSDMPTVIADMEPMARSGEDLPPQGTKPLPMDAPTRVAEPIASLLDMPTADGPPIILTDKPGEDRSPEPDEPTVIRRPSAHDQALLRGDASVLDDEPVETAKVIPVGDGEGEDKGAPSDLHGPKVELAAPLRVQAQIALQEAKARAEKEREEKERADRDAAEQAAPDAGRTKTKEREEVTTASRRMIQLTPELVEQERLAKEREDEAKKKKGWGSTIGLTLATAALVGGGLYLALSKGWFDSGSPPASGSTGVSTRPPPTSPPTATTSAAPLVVPPASAPSTSVSSAPSGAPTVEPTAQPASGISPETAAKANATPGVAVVEANDDAAKLPATRAFLTVLAPASSEELSVYVTGKKVGPINQRLEVTCPIGLIRVGIPLPSGLPDWRSAPGLSIAIPCRKNVVIALAPSKGPWPTPGVRPGGGGTDPY